MARLLKLNVEIVTFRKKFTPIYVYYKKGEEEPVPLYCDNDDKPDGEAIYRTLRNMMFVLSFHPKHTALKGMRDVITRFS